MHDRALKMSLQLIFILSGEAFPLHILMLVVFLAYVFIFPPKIIFYGV